MSGLLLLAGAALPQAPLQEQDTDNMLHVVYCNMAVSQNLQPNHGRLASLKEESVHFWWPRTFLTHM